MTKFYFKMLCAFLLVASSVSTGCDQVKFEILPIDAELNSSLWTLNGMDQRLFDTQSRLQYFELAGYNLLRPKELRTKLVAFISKNYPKDKLSKFKEVGFLFYKKKMFGSYSDQVLYAARDTDNGLIEGEGKQLVAQVWFSKTTKGALNRRVIIFNGNEAVLDDKENLYSSLERVKETKKFSVVVGGNHCLTIKAKNDSLSLGKCYEVDFIEVRKVSEEKLSLTFISGKNAIDIDFYPINNQWIAKQFTFFGASSANRKGVTVEKEIRLKYFDFSEIALVHSR